jgi:hypothetical protein
MAYEALIAERNHIAQEAFKAWQTGGDTEAIIERMARESNIDTYIIKSKLTQLINENHLNRKLEGY